MASGKAWAWSPARAARRKTVLRLTPHRRLVGRTLQVVTNSLPVANLFAANAYADLVLIGGYVYPRTGVSLGAFATQMLDLNARDIQALIFITQIGPALKSPSPDQVKTVEEAAINILFHSK